MRKYHRVPCDPAWPTLRQATLDLVVDRVEKCRGNIKRAAESLDVNRGTVYAMLAEARGETWRKEEQANAV